jgi:hypothetical protein
MMVPMITNTSSLRRSTAGRADAAEQLTLLPNDSVTARFRLSRETRERGLRHVAEIRRMLAERSDTTSIAATGTVSAPGSRHDQAA